MKRFLQCILLGLLMITFLGTIVPVYAQSPTCAFGDFEVPLPSFAGKTICEVADSPTPLITFIATLTNLFLGIIVATGLMMVVVAGYVYMTAGGSADQVGKAKNMIKAALLGIILALAAFMILNTISPQFASKVQEPQLGHPTDLPPGENF